MGYCLQHLNVLVLTNVCTKLEGGSKYSAKKARNELPIEILSHPLKSHEITGVVRSEYEG